MPSPLIHKILFDVELDIPESDAKATSNMLYEKHIVVAFERVLSQFVHFDININHPVEIDLGSIVEGDLGHRFESALQQELTKYTFSTAEKTVREEQTQSAAHVFLSYIRTPVIPWNVVDANDFNIKAVSQKAIREISESKVQFEHLTKLIFGDIETCKRFFELTYRLKEFPSIIKKVISNLPVENSDVYQYIINKIPNSTYEQIEFFKEITFYLVSRALFGNRDDKLKSLLISTLLLLEKGYLRKAETLNVLDTVSNYKNEDDAFTLLLHADENEKLTKKDGQGKLYDRIDTEAKNKFSIESYNIWLSTLELIRIISQQNGITSNAIDRIEQMLDSFFREYRVLVKDSDSNIVLETKQKTESQQTNNNVFSKNELEKRKDIILSGNKSKDSALTTEDRIKLEKSVKAILQRNIETSELQQNTKLFDDINIKNKVDSLLYKQPNLTERIAVYNVGLVLFQPFLLPFFNNLGLLDSQGKFISIEHQIKAIHLLHELSGFNTNPDEHLLILNKMMCGVNMLFPVGTEFKITQKEKEEVTKLVKSVIHHWSVIRNTSVQGFIESFVKRKALMEKSQNDWILRVETKSIDILLDDIPWNFRLITFPWNDYLIHVDWKL